MNKKRFVIFIFLNLFALLIIYIASFYYQLGANVESESWIEPMYQIKDKKALEIGDENKIIIVSGSNSLFGINTEMVSNITNKPVLNLAVHAGLDIDYLYYKINKYIKPNDIIVMPLEYGYYTRNGYSDWFMNNVLVWGNDYFYSLNIFDKIKFIFNLNFDRLALGLKHKLNNEIYKPTENVVDDLTKILNIDGEKWRGYNYKSANLDGDINADESKLEFPLVKYFESNIKVSEHFLNIYNKINELVKNNNAKLILTHPITFNNSRYNLNIQEHQKSINNFLIILSNNNISTNCNPAFFHINDIYSFDTINHANKYGALIRSENLGYCINELIKNPNFNLSYEEAISLTNKLEQKYNSLVKKSNYFKRLEDLNKLKIALENYYKDNGTYPLSKGFDGIYSKWGYSGNEWIKGLSPKYIDELPIDPRNTKDDTLQYLYQSNGKDYKLISHSPEDCKSVEKINKDFIDPSRKCWAYGFWTDGAKNW